MKNNVDLLDKKRTFVRLDAQARQHAVAADGDDFVTELWMFALHLFEELRVMQTGEK